MRVHIVHTHPEEGSFTKAMCDMAAQTLRESGHEVTISDLYAMEFNPVMSRRDFLHDVRLPLAYTREQRYGWRHRTLAPDILAEAERTLAADLLVLTFPVYWFSAPAMLKGWMDRILLSGPFYSGKDQYDRGHMQGRKALVLASVGGHPHMFGPDALHGHLEMGMLRHLFQGTLGVCGYTVLQPFFAHHAPFLEPDARTAILQELQAHVASVEDLPRIVMPTLDDFDAQFRPLAPK